MYTVKLVHQNTSVSVEGGFISDACAQAGAPLNLICNGQGKCGKCRVDIVKNGVKESVLACRTVVDADMEVYIPDDLLARKGTILTEGKAAHATNHNPAVVKECKTRLELIPEHCAAYLTGCSLEVSRKFSQLMAQDDMEKITFVRWRDRVLDVQPGDTTDTLYGVAVDIGTTSVAMFAYDLVSGELLQTESRLNSQIAHGGDVISRILHTLQEPDGLDELNSLILDCLNTMLAAIESKHPGFCENMWNIVLCGNSTMQHLFLRLSPKGLSVDPFVSVTADMMRCTGREAGLNMAPNGVVEFLPLLGGFVGADTSAVLLTLPDDTDKSLMIDLGTNGEIAVGRGGQFKVASTACGPALEGGNIQCGMRGTRGAIEKVSIRDGKVSIRVIDNVEPIGLCGSAIIDAMAELLRNGIVDESGRMLDKTEYAQTYPDSPLLAYMDDVEEYNPAFFFHRGEKPVYICQKDVREIQLAKSSIHSGCVALLAENDWDPSDVSGLFLAGAFGNYIDIDNALYIGLLPAVERDRIHSIGNGAGKGVQMCLLDRAHLDRAERLPQRAEHLELATSPRFMEEYIMNMNFWIS